MKNAIKFFVLTFIILNVSYIGIDLYTGDTIVWRTNLSISILVSLFNGIIGYLK